MAKVRASLPGIWDLLTRDYLHFHNFAENSLLLPDIKFHRVYGSLVVQVTDTAAARPPAAGMARLVTEFGGGHAFENPRNRSRTKVAKL